VKVKMRKQSIMVFKLLFYGNLVCACLKFPFVCQAILLYLKKKHAKRYEAPSWITSSLLR
jgi:hypothetical protein